MRRWFAVMVGLVGCAAVADRGPDAVATPEPDAGEPSVDGGVPEANVDATTLPDAADATTPVPIANPVARDFADPSVIFAEGAFHLYATNTRKKNLPHVTSIDLSQWSLAAENDAMPTLPSWVAPEGVIWAPGVLAVSKTRYVLFYAAKVAGSAPAGERGKMCIGRAVATKPAGPFVDAHDAPMICRPSAWSIDASPFAAADGSFHLVWRQDVDDAAAPTKMNTVHVQALTADGDDFVAGSTSTELVRRTTGSWEEPILENPAMVFAAGKYWLFYSANAWRTADYAIGYATCASPKGPCTKHSTTGPWLGSDAKGTLRGPGGEEIVRGIGGTLTLHAGAPLLVHHGWIAPKVGPTNDPNTTGTRALWLQRLTFGATPTATLLR